MRASDTWDGPRELGKARRQSRALFWAVAIFSLFINALMLTGPIFMLQIYDRVLASRSEATLVALFGLVTFLFLIMAILDLLRGRILTRIGARFQAHLDQRVFLASVASATGARAQSTASGQAMPDLDAVQKFMSSPVLAAFFDLPWTPVFIFAIAVFHPMLGLVAALGGGVLLAIALANQFATTAIFNRAKAAAMRSHLWSAQAHHQAETVQALGMRNAVFRRWSVLHQHQLRCDVRHSDRGGGFATASRIWRMFLQSGMLAMGAYLVLQNQLSPGAMVASSILLGRALAPLELVVGQWPILVRAVAGWRALGATLTVTPPAPSRTSLPQPGARLIVDQLSVVPTAGKPAALKMVSFEVMPGQAVGVIGPSGAGKTTLARALVGAWPPASGTIRLGGVPIDQFGFDQLGQHIGYLPQRVELFDGTVAENIARLALTPDAEMVVIAAKKAAAHDLILALPQGYDTPISGTGAPLSGGQAQRIALARALYGDPVLLVLDEPNSNLDNIGSEALNAAVRQMMQANKAVLIMAHRPAAIQECDVLLMLEGGARKSFGPKDSVLQQMVNNHAQIAATQKSGVA